ncbi:MAG TPA: DUF2569 family protein [Thermoanaerobaculia bacterium]
MESSKSAPSGIGGWLILFVIGQIGVIVMSVSALSSGFDDMWESWSLGDQFSYLRPLLVVENSMMVVQFVVPVVGLTLLFKRSPAAPRVWITYFICVVLYAAFDIGMTKTFVEDLRPLLDESAMVEVENETRKANRLNVRAIFSSLIWGLYWGRSVRVKNTFSPAPASEPIPVSQIETAASHSAHSGSDRFNRPMRDCPYCRESILAAAEYCRHCRSPVAGIPSPA